MAADSAPARRLLPSRPRYTESHRHGAHTPHRRPRRSPDRGNPAGSGQRRGGGGDLRDPRRLGARHRAHHLFPPEHLPAAGAGALRAGHHAVASLLAHPRGPDGPHRHPVDRRAHLRPAGRAVPDGAGGSRPRGGPAGTDPARQSPPPDRRRPAGRVLRRHGGVPAHRAGAGHLPDRGAGVPCLPPGAQQLRADHPPPHRAFASGRRRAALHHRPRRRSRVGRAFRPDGGGPVAFGPADQAPRGGVGGTGRRRLPLRRDRHRYHRRDGESVARCLRPRRHRCRRPPRELGAGGVRTGRDRRRDGRRSGGGRHAGDVWCSPAPRTSPAGTDRPAAGRRRVHPRPVPGPLAVAGRQRPLGAGGRRRSGTSSAGGPDRRDRASGTRCRPRHERTRWRRRAPGTRWSAHRPLP